jgi:hypothetical protein
VDQKKIWQFRGNVCAVEAAPADLLVEWVTHRHIIEARSIHKPRPIGWVLSSCDFLEAVGLVRHTAFSHTITTTGYQFDVPEDMAGR